MVKDHSYRPIFIILSVLFAALTVLWLGLVLTGNLANKTTNTFGATYGIVALVGGLYGLFAARNWGFFISYFGKAIIFLSLGLLLQEFGQLAFTYLYVIKDITVPYPSVADIGFFGAVPMYMAAAFCLFRGLRVGAIVKKNPIKLIIGILVPSLILGICYWVFLKGYIATDKNLLTIFLDFGYPLGQAIYVSIALVVLLASTLLGGVMRRPILLLLFAFVLQYASDFDFLYQSSRGIWVNGGFGDYLYLSAYFVMGASLVYLNRSLAKAFAIGSSTKDG